MILVLKHHEEVKAVWSYSETKLIFVRGIYCVQCDRAAGLPRGAGLQHEQGRPRPAHQVYPHFYSAFFSLTPADFSQKIILRPFIVGFKVFTAIKVKLNQK